MTMIGVRELRQRMSELLRKVREEQTEYVITYQGQPVALLLPLDPEAVAQTLVQLGKRGGTQGWEAYAQTAERVRSRWPATTDTQALLDEIRG